MPCAGADSLCRSKRHRSARTGRNAYAAAWDFLKALPRELTREQGISLVCEYVKRHFVAAGMCADFAIHDTGDGNPYAHIILTMHPFDEHGEWGTKQKKEYILDRTGTKSMTRKSGSTNANPFPLPTGTSRPKPRNGGRHGRGFAIRHWSSTDTRSVSTTAVMNGRG